MSEEKRICRYISFDIKCLQNTLSCFSSTEEFLNFFSDIFHLVKQLTIYINEMFPDRPIEDQKMNELMIAEIMTIMAFHVRNNMDLYNQIMKGITFSEKKINFGWDEEVFGEK